MKKWLACTAIVVALIALPINVGNAFPGGGGHGGGHSGGGGNSGGGNFSGGNHAGNSGANRSYSNGNSGANRSYSNGNNGHPSNGNGHAITKNKSPGPNTVNNSSGKNHSNNKNSGSNNHSNSGHYQYTHHKGQPWDTKEWNHAWYRHWYHTQFIWWGGAWIWWDPDVSNWVPYVEGQYIPEDYYAQGDEPPAGGGGAIRIINPADTQTTINYSINDYDYQIAPGSEQDLSADQQWVIVFNRGENDGDAQYTLSPGEYSFAPSDHGWQLYHTSDTVQ